MRSIVLLLMALAALMVCSTSATSSMKVFGSPKMTYQRALRSETKTNSAADADDSERIFATPKWLTKFEIWKLKREAGFQLNKNAKQLAKEAEKAIKVLEKENKQYDQWLKAKMTPDEIYTKFGLTSLGASATQSSNFRHYEAYREIFNKRAEAGGKGVSWIRKWLINFKLNRLKSKAAAEMKKADKKLAKENEEYTTWMDAGFTPTYMYEKLGLAKLGDRAKKSINFRRWEDYSKLWDSKKVKVSS